MICPHCNTGIHGHFTPQAFFPYTNKESKLRAWQVRWATCSECGGTLIYLGNGNAVVQNHGPAIVGDYTERLVEPTNGARPCPSEVPRDLADDFLEAVAVLPISAQASAALTRRSLQHLLRDYAHTKSKDLADQIEEVMAANVLPSSLAEQLDAVRNIGNFAAHIQKSKATGEIIPVEPQEAEWNLEVLEELFDHFFVKPAKAKIRKDELNAKLVAAGKPPIS